ncbi:MAG: hypothetical protein ABIJ26_06200 [Candidatus Margulisiibacteriota bacterium]
MYPRTNYEMTEEDLGELLDACKPVPLIMLQCGTPSSQQENANRAWKELGKKMGFESDTVLPISGKGTRFFSAVPSETEAQKEERIKRETEEKRLAEIKKTEDEIKKLQDKLSALVKEQ